MGHTADGTHLRRFISLVDVVAYHASPLFHQTVSLPFLFFDTDPLYQKNKLLSRILQDTFAVNKVHQLPGNVGHALDLNADGAQTVKDGVVLGKVHEDKLGIA